MKEIIYRKMTINECDKIKEIDPRHYIKNAWRVVDGKRWLIELNYMENDWPDGYEKYRSELERTIKSEGVAFGAFDINDNLHGFVSLNKRHFGETANYILLDSMFVSHTSRKNGIGKQLFKLCCDEGKINGADKIYICAGSAEDTVAFYKSCGCVEAVEVNKDLYEQDVRDIQLEYKLDKTEK